MTRPIVRPPEPPLQREIRETNEEVNKTKQGLKMTQQELEKTQRFYQQITIGYGKELDKFLHDPDDHELVKAALKKCREQQQCTDCCKSFMTVLHTIKTWVRLSGHP